MKPRRHKPIDTVTPPVDPQEEIIEGEVVDVGGSEAPDADPDLISAAQAGASDTEEKVKKLEERLDKQSGEQKAIIIGVVVAAAILIFTMVAAVVVEILIFNADFNKSLDEFKSQEHQDIQGLENTEIQDRQNFIDTLLKSK